MVERVDLPVSDLPVKTRKEILPASRLRITPHGVFLTGEPTRNQSRIYEDMCAKLARLSHPDKFIISPPVLDRMARAKGSIFSGSRPDSLLLSTDGNRVFLWGMQEYKSGDETTSYKLPQKAGGFRTIMSRLEDNPSAIATDLIDAIGDSYERIPIDLSTVLVPHIVHVDFITHSPATPVSDEAYPRLSLHYREIEAPVRTPSLEKGIEHVVFNAA